MRVTFAKAMISGLGMLVLSGCGGGGGGGSSDNPTSDALVLSGVDLFTSLPQVIEKRTIQLNLQPEQFGQSSVASYAVQMDEVAGANAHWSPSMTFQALGESAYRFDVPAVPDAREVPVRVTATLADGSHVERVLHLAVQALDEAPTAHEDQYAVVLGNTLQVSAADGVLGNDWAEPELRGTQALSVELLSPPAHAANFALHADGSFEYQSATGASATTDRFRYRVSDGGQLSPAAEVLLHLVQENQSPEAQADSYSLVEGAALSVLAEQGLLVNDRDHESADLVVHITEAPKYAQDGNFSVDTRSGALFYQHDGGEASEDTFKYRVSDGQNTSAEVSVTLHIQGVNDAPVAQDDQLSVMEDAQSVALAVLQNDNDPEGAALSVSLVSAPDQGEVVPSQDGRSLLYSAPAEWHGKTQLTYRITDPEGLSDTATVELEILAENDAPNAVADQYQGIDEGSSRQVDAQSGVLSNDTDPEGASLSARLVSAPEHHRGNFQLAADGSFEYRHDGSENHEDQFTYRSSDGQLESELITVRLSIEAVNDAPTGQADLYSANVGQTLSVSANNGVLANDRDVDSQSLRAELVSSPQQADQFSLNANGSISYRPRSNASGNDSFRYRVSDGDKRSDEITVTVRIVNNQGPDTRLGCFRHNQNQGELQGELSSLLSGGGNVRYELSRQAQQGFVQIDYNSGRFTYRSQSNRRGYLDTFYFTVDDLNGGVKEQRVNIIYGIKRIMPLGDSITWGIEANDGAPGQDFAVGYRLSLLQQLNNNGHRADYVGSRKSGSRGGLSDTDNEGWPGQTSQEIANRIYQRLNQNPADIVLLHIGTNDHKTSVDGVRNVLNEIRRWSSGQDTELDIFVATIIDQRADAPYSRTQPAFNQNLRALVRQYDEAELVDQFAALDPESELTPIAQDRTGLHPNRQGYNTMGRTWYRSLRDSGVLPSCP